MLSLHFAWALLQQENYLELILFFIFPSLV